MAKIHSVKTTRLSNRQPSATFSDVAQQDPLEGRTLYVLALCSGIEHRGCYFGERGPSYLFHFALEINLAHLRPTS